MESLPEKVIPITQLSPSNESLDGTVRGAVTIIWPYSTSKQSISILLVERDFRLRRKRGQVRVTFRGYSAAAVAQAKVSSGDELALSLDGAAFLPDTAKEQTPGRGIEWQLEYSRRLHLLIKREGGQQSPLVVNRSTPTPEPEAASLPSTAKGDLVSPPRSPPVVDKNAQFWDSPAFLAHRAVNDHPFLSTFSFDDDDDNNESYEDAKRSKRTKFGRRSGQWRFAERNSTTTKSRSVSEGVSLASNSAFGGRSESRTPEIPLDTSTNLEPADGLFIPGPFVDASLPDDGADNFQQLSQGIIAVAGDEFGQLATSNPPMASLNDSVPLTAAHGTDAVADLFSLEPPDIETGVDFHTDPSSTIPPSDFLISPEFQTFPSEVSPLLHKIDSAEAQPVHQPTDVAIIESPHTLLQSTVLQPSEKVNQEYGRVPSITTRYDPIVAEEPEMKRGTANKPIEIIDLDSDSSSTEAALQAHPARPQEDQASADESASDDEEAREALSSPIEQSDEENDEDRKLHREEASDDEEDEEISYAELEGFQSMSAQMRKTSQGSDGSSTADSEGEADAEGEDYYNEHEVYAARRISVSSSSQHSGDSPRTQDSTSRQRWLSGQSPVEDISERSSEDGCESGYDLSDEIEIKAERLPPHQIHLSEDNEGRVTKGGANREVFDSSENAPIGPGSVTEAKGFPSEAAHQRQAAPTARLVTRGRPEDSEIAVQNDALPPSTENDQHATSETSDKGLPQPPKEQDEPPRYVTFTKLTADATRVAEKIKENFKIGQNVSFEGFRTPLSYFTTIASFAQYYNGRIDAIAVVADQTTIRQAQKGAREYYTTLKLADPWTMEVGSPEYASALIYRRKKSALPECDIGDAVLLRQFQVQQRERKLHLLSCKDSAWAVFTQKHNEQTSVHGPPIELGPEEKQLAEGLQQWWAALEHTTTTKEAEILKKPQKEPRMKAEVLESTPPASPERHVLRDGASYADGPGEAVHKLRDGATYSD